MDLFSLILLDKDNDKLRFSTVLLLTSSFSFWFYWDKSDKDWLITLLFFSTLLKYLLLAGKAKEYLTLNVGMPTLCILFIDDFLCIINIIVKCYIKRIWSMFEEIKADLICSLPVLFCLLAKMIFKFIWHYIPERIFLWFWTCVYLL